MRLKNESEVVVISTILESANLGVDWISVKRHALKVGVSFTYFSLL